MGQQNIGAAVYGRAETWFSIIDLPSHVDLLGALAWEQKIDRRAFARSGPHPGPAAFAPCQRARGLLCRGSNDGSPPPEGLSPNLKGPGHIRQVWILLAPQLRDQIVRCALKRRFRS